MAPRASTAPAQGVELQQPTLTRHELPAHQASYLVNKSEMEELLGNIFGAELDFNVSTKNGRWIYYAARQLTDKEVSKWIAELDKRKRAEEVARASARA